MVCANSPVFEFEKKNISQLLWNTNFVFYCTQEPIKPDRTRTCHAKQWPTPPSKIIPPATASISKIGLQQQQQSSRNHLPATASISKIDLQQLLHQLILKLQQLLGAIHLVLMV